jgi:hypothetical protein
VVLFKFFRFPEELQLQRASKQLVCMQGYELPGRNLTWLLSSVKPMLSLPVSRMRRASVCLLGWVCYIVEHYIYFDHMCHFDVYSRGIYMSFFCMFFFPGTFTKNVVAAAPVIFCKQTLAESTTVCG